MENITMTMTGFAPAARMRTHGSAYRGLRGTAACWTGRGAATVLAGARAVVPAAPQAIKDAFPGTDAWSPPRR